MAARPAAGRTRGNIQAVTNVRLPVGVPGSVPIGPGWGGVFHSRAAPDVVAWHESSAYPRLRLSDGDSPPNRDIATACDRILCMDTDRIPCMDTGP